MMVNQGVQAIVGRPRMEGEVVLKSNTIPVQSIFIDL